MTESLGDKLHHVAEISQKVRSIPSEIQFATRLRERGFTSATLTQCNSIGGLLKLMYQWHLNPDEDFSVNPMTHEHSIPGVIAGIYLGSGKKSAAIFQNSGLPNVGDGFISFAENYEIPLLAISTFRGLGERSYPHQSIAKRTVALARAFVGQKNVYGSPLGRDIIGNLDKAADVVINKGGEPGQAILLLPKIAIRETMGKTPPNKADTDYKPLNSEVRYEKGTILEDYMEKEELSRDEALLEIMQRHEDALIIFCNGLTARAALKVKDRRGNFYNAAYMGGGKAIGYGAAISNPDLSVVVVDGDENAQMGGSMYDILAENYPTNLEIYTLNNGGASSVDGAIPSVRLGYWHYDMTHVIRTRMDDLTGFPHPRVEDGILDLFDPADAEILKQEVGELKFITRSVRRWIVQAGKSTLKDNDGNLMIPEAYFKN